jgi:putative Mn2+ efflux pump MntP
MRADEDLATLVAESYEKGIKAGRQIAALDAFGQGLAEGWKIHMRAVKEWNRSYWIAFACGAWFGCWMMYAWACWK